ncbi:MAG: hypothetical protein KDD89_04735 [Anaerolineales bacterium]|nr:hypothetical protein [Anaerolineales bacterium]
MKRPVLKRVVKIVEIISWTLEYEDIPDAPADESAPRPPPPPPPDEQSPPPPPATP